MNSLSTPHHKSNIMAAQCSPSRCYLLELPPELRLLILEHVWPDDLSQKVFLSGGTCTFAVRKHSPGAALQYILPPLLSCRTIYTEALPFIYERITFEFIIDGFDNTHWFRVADGRSFPDEACFLPRVRKCTVSNHLLNDIEDEAVRKRILSATRVLNENLEVGAHGELLLRSSLAMSMDHETKSLYPAAYDWLVSVQWSGKIVFDFTDAGRHSPKGLYASQEEAEAASERMEERLRSIVKWYVAM